MTARILIIDGDNHRVLVDIVHSLGYETVLPPYNIEPQPVHAAVSKQNYDLVLMGAAILETDGLDAIRLIRSTFADCPIIVITGDIGKASAVVDLKLAIAFGADGGLYEPFGADELDSLIRSMQGL